MHTYMDENSPGFVIQHNGFSREQILVVDLHVSPPETFPISFDRLCSASLRNTDLDVGSDRTKIPLSLVRAYLGAQTRSERIESLENQSDMSLFKQYHMIPWLESR